MWFVFLLLQTETAFPIDPRLDPGGPGPIGTASRLDRPDQATLNTAQHCTLHYTDLHNTAHCTTQIYTTLHIALHRSAQHCTLHNTEHCTTQIYTTLHIAQHYTAQHSTAQICTTLQSSAVFCRGQAVSGCSEETGLRCCAHCTLCTLHALHTLHTAQFAHCTVCTLCTLHGLHTAHCTLHSLNSPHGTVVHGGEFAVV